MHYEDFVIQIGRDDGRGHRVRVVQSPVGEGSGRLRLETAPGEIVKRLAGVRPRAARDTLEGSAVRDVRRRVPRADKVVRETGVELFRGLFRGEVRSLLDRSLGALERRADRGLRVKIKIDPRDPSLSELVGVPWEWLCQGETEDFFSLSRRRSVVRYLEVPRPSKPVELRGPLRVLVAISGPVDLDPLDLDREKELILGVAVGRDDLEIQIIEHATPSAIRDALRRRDCHVFHFMGHGGFDSESGDGVLYFEGADGKAQPTPGRVFANQIKDFETLGLVFLNACNTAKSQGAVEPFAGVASALVLGGVPAVLAMQVPISDWAAIAFSREFYAELASGTTLDEALVEGRQAIQNTDATSVEWGTPVLFQRVPDGNVFERRETLVAEPADTSEVLPLPNPDVASAKDWRHWIVAVGIGLTVVVGGTRVYEGVFPTQNRDPVTEPGPGEVDPEAQAEGSEADELDHAENDPGPHTPPPPIEDSGIAGKADPPPSGHSEPPPNRPRDTTIVEKTAPAEPESIVPAKPKILFELGSWALDESETEIPSFADGFRAKITKLEMRPGGQLRCHVMLYNGSELPVMLGLDLANTRVSDDAGGMYSMLGADRNAEALDRTLIEMPAGTVSTHWFDFSEPLEGSENISLWLVGYDQSDVSFGKAVSRLVS